MRTAIAPKGKAAASALVSNAATFQTNQLNQVTQSSEPDGSARLTLLQQQFAQHGLGVRQLMGAELAVTGPRAPGRVFPDARSAWMYLRQLREGLA